MEWLKYVMVILHGWSFEAMLAASRAEVCALSFLSTCLMASATASQKEEVEARSSALLFYIVDSYNIIVVEGVSPPHQSNQSSIIKK